MWSKQSIGRNWFLKQAELLLSVILSLKCKAREFFFAAVLSRHSCPSCCGPLSMVEDSLCQCLVCTHQFDPTLQFQRCPECGAAVQRQTYHYACSACGQQVRSRFTFDRKVFDKAYFAEMMQASRERKRKKRESLQRMLRNARSCDYIMDQSPELCEVPGLIESLDAFISSPIPAELVSAFLQRPEFDLVRYESHILASLDRDQIDFDYVEPLLDDLRLDRIFRFIAIIFLHHHGQIDLRQSGPIIAISRK